MRKLNIFTLSLVFSLLTTLSLKAQQYPMKFGKVDKSDLEMTESPIDKDANAMVLCEFGTIRFDLDDEGSIITKFYYHTRIKVFNKDGLNQGNITIPYYVGGTDSKEKITSIKAASYHLEKGKVVSSKFSPKDIHHEQVTKTVHTKSFAIPNIKEGSVIEYTYQIKSDFITNLRSWDFQEEIPVKWSEYRVSIPKNFDYERIARGNPNFSIQTSTPSSITYTGYGASVPAITYRWVAENMTGLTEEPYNSHIKDYATQIEFQLTGYRLNSGGYKPVASDYKTFNNRVWESYGYKELLTAPNTYVKDITDGLIADKTEPMDKAIAIYEHVKNRMAVEGNSYFKTKNTKKAYNDGAGRVSDINLMLAVMLNHAGISAKPVILATRSLGRPHPVYPNSDRFNYVVLLTTIGDKNYFVDAGNTNALPFGTLPSKCLNGQGWLVDPNNSGWVNLQSGAKNSTITLANLSLTEDGEISGKIDITYKSYSALSVRSSKSGPDDEALQDRLSTALTDWEVSDAKWSEKKNIYKPLKLSFNLTQELEDPDMIYLSPSVYGLEKENPFKSETRKLPIDFPFAQGRRYIFYFTLPEGYIVDELPKPIRISLPNKGGSFTYNVSQLGNKITLINNLKLNQTFFSLEEYESLRKFYEMVIAKNAEQIVIKKATE